MQTQKHSEKRRTGFRRGALIIIGMLLFGLPSQSQGLDERINEGFMPIADWWVQLVFFKVTIAGYSIPIVLLLLSGGAIFFTLYFSFINVRRIGTALAIVRGKYDHIEEASSGEVNHFQALTTAISGTVGLGNISMVAVAITAGGPGITFWMIISGLLGMSSKFVECTLGVKYREIDQEGHVYGGPMYYLKKGLANKGKGKLGRILASVFAVICVGASLGGGNAFQSNQVAAQLIRQFEWSDSAAGTIIGLTMAALAGIVIIGGIKSIARITEKLVPFMAFVYISAALYIIVTHFHIMGEVASLIWEEAFTPRASIVGGFTSVIIFGFRRGAFSNEAGTGSAAIAHSAVHTRFPASEGLVALLEPLIDSVIICTITAVVIIIFNREGAFVYGDVVNEKALILASGERVGGVNLTSVAFDGLVPGFSYVLVLAVMLFGFSTILSWSYYGIQAWKFLFGRGKAADMLFKVLFLSFTILGAAVTLDAVIKFSDAMILALVFPNMIGLFFLFSEVKTELKNYLKIIKKRL